MDLVGKENCLVKGGMAVPLVHEIIISGGWLESNIAQYVDYIRGFCALCAEHHSQIGLHFINIGMYVGIIKPFDIPLFHNITLLEKNTY